MWLIKWLEVEIIGWNIVWTIIIFSIANVCYALIVLRVFKYFFGKNALFDKNERPNIVEIANFEFLFFLFFAALIEEFFFKFCFLSLPVFFLGSSMKVLAVAIISSFIFGILHESPFLLKLANQGVSGFATCLLFLKCGGFQQHFLKALFVVTITHFLYNVFLLVIVLIKGETHVSL